VKKNKKTKKIVLDLGTVGGLYEALLATAALNLRTPNNEAVAILVETFKNNRDTAADSLYDVVIEGVPSVEQARREGFAYIPLIKAIRSLTDLGLKEAKDLIDGCKGSTHPRIILTSVTKDQVAEIKNSLDLAVYGYIKFRPNEITKFVNR
jgi:ribosomal protein L7/L12